MSQLSSYRSLLGACSAALLYCAPLAAQITLDGTLGPAGALDGPDYTISAEVGQQFGVNLFHSFGAFNINTGERATFTGPTSVANVLGRVTGGDPSSIDGVLASLIPGADVFLINPSGIAFGSNARLDVSGSFHASTADYLRLGDSGRFDATRPANSVLSAATPDAFGFLAPPIGDVSIRESVLVVPKGRSLSLSGGDISISGGPEGVLAAPGGRIDITSVASAGELRFSDAGPDTDSFSAFGDLEIRDLGLVTVDGDPGGSIFVRAGRLSLDGSVLSANSSGAADGAVTAIAITADTLILSGGSEAITGLFANVQNNSGGDAGRLRIDASQIRIDAGGVISASTFGAGDAGDLSINTGELRINGDGASVTGLFAQADAGSSGAGGDLSITAQALELQNGAQISASTFGAGDAGNLSITSGHLLIIAGEPGQMPTGIGAQASLESNGAGGKVTISADAIELRSGGVITAGTLANGRGGDLTITTERLFIAGEGFPAFTGISTQSNLGSGDAGDLRISADTIELRSGGQITTATLAEGRGGDLTLNANRLLLEGGGSNFFTGVFSAAGFQSSGDGGDLSVEAGDIQLRNGAQISANTSGTGRGGNIDLRAGRLLIAGPSPNPFIDTGVITQAEFGSSGDAGDLAISAGSIELLAGGGISAATFGTGRSGDLTVSSGGSIFISGGDSFGRRSGLFTSTAGPGRGGDIDLTAGSTVTLSDGGTLSASSTAQGGAGETFGNAGTIRVAAGGVFRNRGGLVATEARQAAGGNIVISARSIQLTEQGPVTASVTRGEGGGGNIVLNADTIAALENSDIIARADQGFGGNILINTEVFLRSADVNIDASSNVAGREGRVEIVAPDVDLSAPLTALPASFFDVTNLLLGACDERWLDQAGRLSIAGRSAFPPAPDALPLAPPRASQPSCASRDYRTTLKRSPGHRSQRR